MDGFKSTADVLPLLADAGLGHDFLLRRLAANQIPARAAVLLVATHYRVGRGAPALKPRNEDAFIPDWFWPSLIESCDYRPKLDWKAGDFETWAEVRGAGLVATALGVTLDIGAVRTLLPARPAPLARGRRKGVGSLVEADRPIVEKMRAAIQSGEATGAKQASQMYRHLAQGSGAAESIEKRLERRYAQIYG